jgi:hypothetical protein
MAAPTPYSYRQYQGDGVTRSYSVPFPYLKQADVRVMVDGATLVDGVGYSWVGNTQVQLTTATNKLIEVRRVTPEDLQLVQWLDGSYIIQDDLNTSDLQWLYLLQEHHDQLQEIINSGNKVVDATEATKGIVRLATVSETAAGTSKLLAVHPAGLRAEIEKVEAVIAVMEGQINGKAPLSSPAFTGTPTAPTPSAGEDSTRIATTGWAKALLADKAPLDSPHLTGTPQAPTAAPGTNNSQLATTAFVKAAVAAGGGTGGGTGGTVPDASEVDKGIVQLATAAETTAGTNGTKAVHPAGLKAALDLKAPLASPGFSGAPTAPTAAQGTNTTQLATTAFVNARTPNATETVVGMVELATAAEAQAGAVNTRAVHPAGLKAAIDQAVASYAPLNSPALTGTPTAPTATGGDNSSKVATTAFVQAALGSGATVPAASETVAGKVELATAAETTTGTDNTRAVHPAGLKVELDKKAPLASPGFSGTPTAPTAAPGTNTTQLATTAFVVDRTPAATEMVSGVVELASSAEVLAGTDNTRAVHPAGLKTALDQKAPLTSPALSGTPTAPTASPGTNNTQIATTAFVQAAATAGGQPFGVDLFVTPGNTQWVCPEGVTKATVTVIGGGGGAYATTTELPRAGAGGFGCGVVTVVPGTSYPITVGAGGQGKAGTTPQGAGGSSSFGSTFTATGGQPNSANNGGTAGTDGTCTAAEANLRRGHANNLSAPFLSGTNTNVVQAVATPGSWTVSTIARPGTPGQGNGSTTGAHGMSGAVLIMY